MTGTTPFLMFQGGTAQAALDFYVATVPGSRLVSVGAVRRGRPGAGGHDPARGGGDRRPARDVARQLHHARVRIHAIAFVFRRLRRRGEIDRLFAALGDGGQELIPLGNYGWGRKFGWLNDRFGVSWQLELA